MFSMVGQFFCSSEELNPWKHGCSCKCGGAKSDAAGFNRGVSCCSREDERRLAWKCASTCIYAYVFPAVWKRKEGNAQAFLDFLLPEQVNTNVFPHKDKKSDCKRVCLKSVFPHIIYPVLKNLDIPDVFPQKHGNANVYPHENTQMARERDSVSSSHHHRAWKRVCLKHLFFCVSSRLKSAAVFLVQTHPNRCFSQKPSHFEVKSQGCDVQRERRNLPESQNKWEKNTATFNAKKYKRYILTYKTYLQLNFNRSFYKGPKSYLISRHNIVEDHLWSGQMNQHWAPGPCPTVVTIKNCWC